MIAHGGKLQQNIVRKINAEGKDKRTNSSKACIHIRVYTVYSQTHFSNDTNITHALCTNTFPSYPLLFPRKHSPHQRGIFSAVKKKIGGGGGGVVQVTMLFILFTRNVQSSM